MLQILERVSVIWMLAAFATMIAASWRDVLPVWLDSYDAGQLRALAYGIALAPLIIIAFLHGRRVQR